MTPWPDTDMARRFIVSLLTALLLCVSSGHAVALTLINPYPATGAVDITGTVIMSRALRAMQNQITPSTTDALARHLGQSMAAEFENGVIVQRNPRGGGVEAAAATAADDAMVLFAGSGLAASAALTAFQGLQPIALVATVPTILVTATEGSATITQLMAQAGRQSLIGIAGERTAGQVLFAQMRHQWPRGLNAVTYNGGNGALRGVMARQVAAALVPLPAALPYATGHRIRILAIADTRRHAALPAVPTFAEAQMPAATITGWHGLFVSPAMPAARVAQIQRALAITLNQDASLAAVSALGYGPDYRGAAALSMALMADVEREVRATDRVAFAGKRTAGFSDRFLPAASPH